MVKAANWLELQGVRAIMANCGFFGNYQKIISDRIDTPFFSSSLIQLPTIIQSLPRGKKVGVITANADVLRACPAIENCGVSVEDKANRLVIDDCGDSDAFAPIVQQDSDEFDIHAIEKAIVTAAKRLANNPEIAAILLECTELPPAAHAVQSAVRLAASWGQVMNTDEDQIATELYYRWQMAQNVAITPSVQLLSNPALNSVDPSVVVWGLRARITF